MLPLMTTGLGLSIVVRCRYEVPHDWMSFAAWYSISKNLPDAAVVVEYAVDKSAVPLIFHWPRRCGVPLHKGWSKEYPEQTLIIPPHVMAVRELSGQEIGRELNDALCCEAGEDRMVPFVSYERGCGAFVTTNWINTMDCPFPWADRFMTDTVTTNEVRVLRLWQQLNPLYITVRG